MGIRPERGLWARDANTGRPASQQRRLVLSDVMFHLSDLRAEVYQPNLVGPDICKELSSLSLTNFSLSS